jgi:long-chain acyl-CoA synthetase
MREYAVPAVDEVTDGESLSDAVFDNAERYPDLVSFRRKVGSNWVDVSAKEFADLVTSLAQGLIAVGVNHGDRVALLSRTRFEWTLLDYAIVAVGAATVPIYQTSSDDQIEWILADSEAVAAVVESDAHLASVAALRERLPALRHVWQLEPARGTGAVRRLMAEGAAVPAEEVARRRAGVRADDLATLIYTSGTTGRPKGCELTHRNLVTEVKTSGVVLGDLLSEQSSLLLFLPLAHVLAKIIQCGGVYTRTTIGHVADTSRLLEDLAEFRPSFVLSVPRVFEKVFNAAQQKAHAAGRGKAAIFDAAAATAEEYSRAQPDPGLLLRARHAVFDRLVYGKLRAALGGRCVAAASGGAALGERLGHFFRGIGLPVYEGYGLTETSGAATVNAPGAQRIGTVGRPLAGSRVRIADDGEILLGGDVVFRGYWKNPDATREAMRDGWFYTGDLGELDDDGYLRITGRKKELIVTAGGKNVAPAVLEDRLRAHPLISQCMLVGDGQPFIAALITLDPDALPAWREEHDKPPVGSATEPSDLVEDPDLLAEIDAAVAEANQAVSHAEAIKKFKVLPVDFTEAGGELTPTLKVKRNVVSKTYAEDIAELYRKPAASRG